MIDIGSFPSTAPNVGDRVRWHWPAGNVWVRPGDCLEVLRTYGDESIDAVVTDPPYGLAEHKPATLAATLTAWLNGDREQVPDQKGFMGRSWDGFVPPPAVWDECLRVLKPGGHMLVFAGSRTVDLMGLSIRLAGFELRDEIMWCYGSGPKSLDVSKAIDKARDDKADVLRVTSWLADHAEEKGVSRGDVDAHMGTSDMGGWWLSRLRHRCQVPRWEQWERLRELLGFGDEMDAEVWRLNGRKGTPGEAWEQREVTQHATRPLDPGDVISFDQRSSTERERRDIPATDAAKQWAGFGTALKPGHEPILVCRKPLAGTVAANVQEHGTGALNIDACRVTTTAPVQRAAGGMGYHGSEEQYQLGDGRQYGTAGRWPTNVVLVHSPDCGQTPEHSDEPQWVSGGPGKSAFEDYRWECDCGHRYGNATPEDGDVNVQHAAHLNSVRHCAEGCPIFEMDQQSGVLHSQNPATRKSRSKRVGATGFGTGESVEYADKGGASRFFPSFKYQAKAPTKERPKVDGKSHPTVKPLELMRWLVRLVGGQPGSVILDPFAGTGTTGQAAELEGFRAVLIERDELALRLIRERLGDVEHEFVDVPEPVAEVTLFDLIARGADRAELLSLWKEHQDEWTDEHTAAVKARLTGKEEAA